MVTLLEAARDSEKTFKESLISMTEQTKALISDYLTQYHQDSNSLFNTIKNAPFLHQNPILKNTQGNVTRNKNTFESQGHYFLKKAEIQEFYDNGFIAQKYKFPNLTNQDLQKIQKEYIDFKNKCHNGIYEPVYRKLPDYVGHLYLPSIIKLLKENYDFIVQKSMSIFNAPEEELFFAVGIFLVDETEKGTQIHQDYSYHVFDQINPDIDTSLITFHTAISNTGISRFYLFPGTHKEILHTLTTLKYLKDHNIDIDETMALSSGGLTEYVIKNKQLPYENTEALVFSHLARYPQQLYVLDKYKNNDITGYEVNTKPGEFLLFDPAILHSNGATTGNIDELIKSLTREIGDHNISRLSLAIRVIHTKKATDYLLWMSAREKIEVLKNFFKNACVNINKNTKEFYTVLSNNKLSSPDALYFSVNEMYNLHAQTGAYSD